MAHRETAYIGDTGKGRYAQRQALTETFRRQPHRVYPWGLGIYYKYIGTQTHTDRLTYRFLREYTYIEAC